MDKSMEYHDPDYPEASTSNRNAGPKLTEEEKEKRIKVIVEREFSNEMAYKEEELNLIDQR